MNKLLGLDGGEKNTKIITLFKSFVVFAVDDDVITLCAEDVGIEVGLEGFRSNDSTDCSISCRLLLPPFLNRPKCKLY